MQNSKRAIVTPDSQRPDRSPRRDRKLGETQVMTYPYYVGILKHSPPTIYHRQGLASGSHTGPR